MLVLKSMQEERPKAHKAWQTQRNRTQGWDISATTFTNTNTINCKKAEPPVANKKQKVWFTCSDHAWESATDVWTETRTTMSVLELQIRIRLNSVHSPCELACFLERTYGSEAARCRCCCGSACWVGQLRSLEVRIEFGRIRSSL